MGGSLRSSLILSLQINGNSHIFCRAPFSHFFRRFRISASLWKPETICFTVTAATLLSRRRTFIFVAMKLGKPVTLSSILVVLRSVWQSFNSFPTSTSQLLSSLLRGSNVSSRCCSGSRLLSHAHRDVSFDSALAGSVPLRGHSRICSMMSAFIVKLCQNVMVRHHAWAWAISSAQKLGHFFDLRCWIGEKWKD